MDELQEFFAMGGYAFYVWTSYAIAFLMLTGIVVWSQRTLRRTRTQTFKRARQSRTRS